ncbi:MAG: glutamine--fructose-6-phosphate transaminase (isomerizing), partial [Rhodobiaceae bacterium]|nr:glutamine--fructose-6-phosphate transaminase (isomerizing) [Rhodobiaceae bacterium]
MCGIVGIIGKQPVALGLVDALRRLEYRGYDSAGIATLEGGHLSRRRAEGKLRNLEARLTELPLNGTIGIGHTRWATHGAPTEGNAHPHVTGKVGVVHNGIIENYRELKNELAAAGAKFETETDSEVIAQIVAHEMGKGLSPEDAVAASLKRLEGAFALVFIFEGYDDLLIGARRGSPLAVGHGDGEMFLGSDAIALSPFTNRVTYLEDGDWVVITSSSLVIRDETGCEVLRPMQTSLASALMVDKGNHRHFMLKEIYEQPEVIGHTLANYLDMAAGTVKLPDGLPFDFANLDRITITACGTAYYAGLVAKYWFEQYARIPVDIDVASEFRYRETPLKEGGLAIFISQSGETADTLASLRYCRAEKQHTLAIVNVRESTIARESETVLPTYAGPEIGVASTKAFTCQLSVLAALA